MSDALEHENRQLRKQLHSFKLEARHNESLLKKFQERELALLGCSSLAELLVSLTEGLRLSFDLDRIHLALDDHQHEIRKLLQHCNTPPEFFPEINFNCSAAELECNLNSAHQPWLGPCLQARHGRLVDTSESRSLAILPLNIQGILSGCLIMGSHDPRRFTRNHATDFLQRLAAIASICLENAINRERIILNGLTDALTGYYNRAYLERRLQEEISRAARYQQPLSCLFLDIDFFKRVNDNYGHACGDQVLREVARRVQTQLRASDIPTRFGGEEFTILLPQTTSREALLLGERIRLQIQDTPVSIDDHQHLDITLSIGISQILPGQQQSLEGLGAKLLHDADTALYKAKQGGRNQAVLG